MDVEKYQRLFVEEARENLRVYHQSLASLDAADEPPNNTLRSDEIVHELFRAAHSMKGMAASLGHTHFAEVAHGLEELADRGRQGEAIPAPDIALLVRGGDLLASLLEQIQDGAETDTEACSALLVQIRARTDARMPEAESSAAGESKHPAIQDATLPDGKWAPESGEVALQVWLQPDISMPKARAFLVHRQLAQHPNFLRADPTPETWSELHEARGFLWFLLTKQGLSQPELTELVEGATGVARVVWHEAPTGEEDAEARVQASGPAPGAAPVASAHISRSQKAAAWQRSVRVRASLLDGFMDSVSELLLTRARLRVVASQSHETQLLDLVDDIERQIKDLHARVVAARMTPLHFLTDALPRSVRDMARQTGKAVRIVIEGADIEVDRAILDELHAPMVHLLRNSVDHGHEGNTERRARNKSEEMTLRLTARREDENLVLRFADDGAGIDAEKVAEKALQKGLATAVQLSSFEPGQILDLICAPGFSTRSEVTDLSGRGVGMDVVKQGVERLGGKLEIASNPGEGTRIQIRLPLTVSLMQVLLVEPLLSPVGDNTREAPNLMPPDGNVYGKFPMGAESARPIFAIPAQKVLRVLPLHEGVDTGVPETPHVLVDELAVPLYDLAASLGYRSASRQSSVALVVDHGTEKIAFRAARVLGQEEVVAKGLAFPLSRVAYLAGAALLADGQAAFILEPGRLPLSAEAIGDSENCAGVAQS